MPQTSTVPPPPPNPSLSPSQLAKLRELGEERTAEVGEVLYRVGDREYPFIALLEGEVAILDSAGDEITRNGPSGFLGELNLLSGQTVFVTAVVIQPARYVAVERNVLRSPCTRTGRSAMLCCRHSSPHATGSSASTASASKSSDPTRRRQP